MKGLVSPKHAAYMISILLKGHCALNLLSTVRKHRAGFLRLCSDVSVAVVDQAKLFAVAKPNRLNSLFSDSVS